MRIYTIIATGLALLLLPWLSMADEFLGAPVIPGGEIVQQTKKRMVIRTNQTHDEVLSYYKKELKDLPDLKYREWKDETYIEDDGAMKWHSITISKGNEEAATVTIKKDNWTWIIGTLILRYIGVFVVLLVLFLAMSASGSIISRTIKRMEAKKSGA